MRGRRGGGGREVREVRGGEERKKERMILTQRQTML